VQQFSKLATCLDESYQLQGYLIDEFTTIVKIPALACLIRDHMEVSVIYYAKQRVT
jgi:hypothetical protein